MACGKLLVVVYGENYISRLACIIDNSFLYLLLLCFIKYLTDIVGSIFDYLLFTWFHFTVSLPDGLLFKRGREDLRSVSITVSSDQQTNCFRLICVALGLVNPPWTRFSTRDKPWKRPGEK